MDDAIRRGSARKFNAGILALSGVAVLGAVTVRFALNGDLCAGSSDAAARLVSPDTSLLWIAGAGGLMLAVVVLSIVVHRKRSMPSGRGRGSLLIEISWAVIPVLMVLGVATAAAGLLPERAHGLAGVTSDPARVATATVGREPHSGVGSGVRATREESSLQGLVSGSVCL